MRRPAPIAYQDRQTISSRPGWVDRPPQRAGVSRNQRPPQRDLVCHNCYQHGHISPSCMVDISQEPDVIARNYEALSRDILRSIPATSYWMSRDIIDSRTIGAGTSAAPPQQSEVHPRVLPDNSRQHGGDKRHDSAGKAQRGAP